MVPTRLVYIIVHGDKQANMGGGGGGEGWR